MQGTADLLILYFMTYSIIGYFVEVTYCSIPKRHFVNRGFLYGPYLPIYGSGAMLVALTFSYLSLPWYLVFILSIIGTGIIEYVTSWALEKIFNIKLWDYSKNFMNINGRVCLKNALMFGVLSLAVVYLIHPFMTKLYSSINPLVVYYLAYVLVIVFSIDTTLSITHLLNFKAKLHSFTSKLREYEAERKIAGNSILKDLKLQMEEEYEKFRSSISASMEHIVNSNPSLSSANGEIRDAIQKIKEEIKMRKDKKNAKR